MSLLRLTKGDRGVTSQLSLEVGEPVLAGNVLALQSIVMLAGQVSLGDIVHHGNHLHTSVRVTAFIKGSGSRDRFILWTSRGNHALSA
jgi:hypothetical protein